jgi:hypothetical protein
MPAGEQGIGNIFRQSPAEPAADFVARMIAPLGQRLHPRKLPAAPPRSALRRVDERVQALEQRRNLSRREEITEEIALILLNRPTPPH